jgi:hypothetical protein
MLSKLNISVLFLSIIGLTKLSFGQAGNIGNLHFQAEYGLNLYKTDNNLDFKESSLTGGTDLSIGVQYNTHHRVGLRLEMSKIDYTMTDSIDKNDNLSIGAMGLGVNYYLINTDKFTLQLGAEVGGFNLDYERNTLDASGAETNVSLKANGYYQKINLNAAKYFGKKHQFGVNLKVGIMNAPFQWDTLQIDDVDQGEIGGRSTTDIITNQIGLFGHIGLTYYLRMKKDI